MAHNTPEGRAPAVQRGHEIFDLDVSYVRWFSLGIVVLLIVTAAAAFAMLRGFRIPHPATLCRAGLRRVGVCALCDPAERAAR